MGMKTDVSHHILVNTNGQKYKYIIKYSITYFIVNQKFISPQRSLQLMIVWT